MRKVGFLLALWLMAAAAAASAGAGGQVKYRARHLPFRFSFFHPTELKARFAGFVWPPYGTPQYLIVALSTDRLKDPAGTLRHGGAALDTLPPEGVLVEWWLDASAFYGPKLTGVPGNTTHVDGALAKIVIDPTNNTAGGICPKSTTGSVKLYIAGTAQPASGIGRPPVYMYACTNTTNFPRFMARLLPMVRSVRLGP